MREKIKSIIFENKRIKLYFIFLLISFIFLLAATPAFYPLKYLFIHAVEKFVMKRELNHPHWFEIINYWLLNFSACFLIISLYLYFFKEAVLRYFYPIVIILLFIFSNIYLIKNGFNEGYCSSWTFNDFLQNIEGYANTGFYETNYPPLAVVFYKLCYLIFPKTSEIDTIFVKKYCLTFLFFFSVIPLFILFQNNFKSDEKHKNLFAFSFFLTSPLLFTYQRMNLILFAFIFTLFFILYYNSPSKYKRFFSYLSLAIAANLKYFPVIFGLVLLKEKKWKAAITCFCLGLFLFIFPAFIPKNNQIQENSIQSSEAQMTSQIESMPEKETIIKKVSNIVSHTIEFTKNPHVISSVSIQAISARAANKIDLSATAQKVVMYVSLLIFLIISIFAFFITKDTHNQLLLLSMLAILTPISTAWYSIIFLFIPFMELLRKDKFSIFEHFEFILYCLIFVFVMDNHFEFLMPSEPGHWRIILLYFVVVISIIREFILLKKVKQERVDEHSIS